VQPDTNALAFVLVTVTVLGGIVYEVIRRREVRRAEARARRDGGRGGSHARDAAAR
jgi:hypothetical protein